MKKSRLKLWAKQIEMQEEMQEKGLNIISCGCCNTLIIHKCDDKNDVTCHVCHKNLDLSDCPDYYYRGMPIY